MRAIGQNTGGLRPDREQDQLPRRRAAREPTRHESADLHVGELLGLLSGRSHGIEHRLAVPPPLQLPDGLV